MFLLIGFSRMYLGVHTPKDVVVSMAVSLCTSFAVYKASDSFWIPRDTEGWFFCHSCSFFCCQYLCLIPTFPWDISLHYASDCCKASAAGIGFGCRLVSWKSLCEFFRQRIDPVSDWKTHYRSSRRVSFKIGIEFLFGDSLPADMFAYFLLVLWVIFLYPWILKNFIDHLPLKLIYFRCPNGHLISFCEHYP